MSVFIRVPYYIGDLKRDPNLENYPLGASQGSCSRSTVLEEPQS